MSYMESCRYCNGRKGGCKSCYGSGLLPTEEGAAVLRLLAWKERANAKPVWEWDRYVNPFVESGS